MASSGGPKMVKSECDYCRKNHDGECWKKLGVWFGCRSRDHLIKDYQSKPKFNIEQSVKSPQKFQHENKSKMVAKTSLV